MDLNWLANEEEFEDSLHIAGLSLHDKWIWSSLQRQPSTSEEPRKWNCILCKTLWPEVLLWPGRMKLRMSQEEGHALAGALSAQGRILDSRYVRGVYFSVGTLILGISDEVEPQAEFLPPSLCPACCVTVQNKPLQADSGITNSILVKSSSVDLRIVPMRIALDNAQNVFSHDGDDMILSEEMLELGFGRRALRLLLPSAKSMYSSLRQGVPGCSIDYLPEAPARLTIVVYSASLHIQKQRDTPALNSFEVANWLSSAANCDIVSCENSNTHLVVVELANIDSWYRALALNGEIWQNTVMNVRGTEIEIANANLRQHRRFSPATRRIMLHWFRALRRLGVVAKNLVVAFLGEPPIIVPNDIASIEEALKASRDIIIAAGTYELPRGLMIYSAADLTGDGEVFLRLGSEVQVQSKSGANFRNLHFVASNVSAVISIRSSYLVALGRGHRAYSDQTPIGSKSAFACCSFGQFAVNLTKCTIQGGRHSVDVRGGGGIRARTGKRLRGSSRHPALHYHDSDGLDFGRWLEHCRNHGDQEPRIEFSRKSNAYVPVWKPHKMTFVRMIDCEISNSRTEAVNVWRGARLEMIRCWIHSCGQGVSVSHFLTPTDLGVFKEFQVTPHVSIRECLFENIAKKDWSSAISIGRFVTLGADQSSLTKTLTQCTYRGKPELNGQIGLVVELFHNTLRFCSGGVTAFESNLLAHGNKAEDMKYAAFHIFNGVASLEENEINRCASALMARSGQSKITGSAKLNLRSNLLQNSEIGLRLATSASGAPLQLELAQDSLTNLGNGAILQGSLCKVAMKDCLISHCKRIGLHALREASVKLLQCRISDNGRGVVIASRSAAQIHGCSFERNIGWAIRFEAEGPEQAQAEPSEQDLGASRALNALRSDVTFNEFGAPSKGNAGRKRVRVDTRNAYVLCLGNREPGDGGQMVEPQVKCQKT